VATRADPPAVEVRGLTVDEPIPAHLQGIADHLYMVFTDWVPSCGCGYPDDAMRLIRDLLRVAESGAPDREQQYEKLCGTTGALQIVLAALDKAELMSHATTITLSSATDRGRWVLWAIDQLGGIDRLPAAMDASGYPHYEPGAIEAPECTDACWTISAGSAKGDRP
jgi:hypothetical protein